MSYKEFKEEHKSTDFAPFLKAKHITSFPLKVEIMSVDKQRLPKTGDSLVARVRLTTALRSKLTKEYLAELEKARTKDIGFPLNKTNADLFAKLFGDSIKTWQGTVTLVGVPVRNPQTDQLTTGLSVMVQGEAK